MFRIINEMGKTLCTKTGNALVFNKADDAINYAHGCEPYPNAYAVVASSPLLKGKQ